jgi:hypothetical protein
MLLMKQGFYKNILSFFGIFFGWVRDTQSIYKGSVTELSL